MKSPLAAALVLAALACCGRNAVDKEAWVPVDILVQEDSAQGRPAYPRPQLVRDRWASLGGSWNYTVTPADAPCPEDWDGPADTTRAGMAALMSPGRAVWYGTAFKVPASWRKQRLRLNLGTDDRSAEVYVNGRLAGSHTSSLDLTRFLTRASWQQLAVRFAPGGDDGSRPAFPEGIWLEPLPKACVTSYQAVADMESGTVDVTVSTEGATDRDHVEIWLREGGTGFRTEDPGETATVAFASVAPGVPVRLSVSGPKCWSEEFPFRYELEIRLLRGRKVLDQVRGYTAFLPER